MRCTISIFLFLISNLLQAKTYNPKLESDEYFLSIEYRKETLKKFSEQWASKFLLRKEIVKAVIDQESQWDTTATSVVDARGLMQVLVGTASDMGMSENESLYNPYTNIYYGCRYLEKLLKRYDGDYFYSLVGYYAGPGNSDKLKEGKLKNREYINKITNYALDVLSKSYRYMEVSTDDKEENIYAKLP